MCASLCLDCCCGIQKGQCWRLCLSWVPELCVRARVYLGVCDHVHGQKLPLACADSVRVRVYTLRQVACASRTVLCGLPGIHALLSAGGRALEELRSCCWHHADDRSSCRHDP